MSFNDNSWIDFTFEVDKTIGFINLPFSIKEQVCRFLKNKKDKHEMALIHRDWSNAAQAVLFEDVCFDRPDQLRSFMATIKTWNRIALLVKAVQLTYVDHEEDTVFKSIVKSHKPRHSYNTPLKDLNILTSIIKTCEKIESITIYGWDMQTYHIETLASYAKHLTSLYIIGANHKLATPIPLNSVLPNLTTLRLDGNFRLTESWATTLTHKGLRLRKLQISLQEMHREVFMKICTQNLKLEELTLTDCASLRDTHVSNIVITWPHLKKLCIQGARYLTSATPALALKYCPSLVDLEIRSVNSEEVEIDINETSKLLHNAARPTRFVLENMLISDKELMLFSPFLTKLNTLGLKNCKLLTNKSLTHIFNVNSTPKKFLRHLYLSHCPHITSVLLANISAIDSLSQCIMDVTIESCGDISPKDIYKLCCSSINYNLKRLTFLDYRSLEKTIIGSFNENTDTNIPKIILNKQSIDALAHSKDYELRQIPEERTLTGHQIIFLAKYLGMNTEVLEDLLEKAEEEDYQRQQQQQHNIQKNNIPADLSKRNDRLSILKATGGSSSSEPRPNTPAIWNKDFQNGFLTMENGHEEDFTENSELTSYDNDDSYDFSSNDNDHDRRSYNNENDRRIYSNDDERRSFSDNDDDRHSYSNDDDRNEQEEQYHDDYYNDEGSRNEEGDGYEDDQEQEYDDQADVDYDSEQNNNGIWRDEEHLESSGEIDLGGWGPSNNDWSPPSNSVCKSVSTPNKPHQLSFQEIQQQQQQQKQQQQQQQQLEKRVQQGTSWNGYRAEDYKDNWVANPLEFQSPVKKQNTQGHSRSRPNVIENDGWGVPEKYVAWEDTKEQGFAVEVIKRQKETPYWQERESGWTILNNRDETKEPVKQISTKGSTAVLSEKEFPLLKSSSARDKVTVSFESLAEQTRQDTPRSRFSRARSSSVVSSDSDVNWDSKETVQYKVQNGEQEYESPPKLPVNGVRKTPGKWANAPEWKAEKEAKKENWESELPTTSTKAIKPDSTKIDTNTPTYEDDLKGAKNWSSFVNNNVSSSSSRRGYSRPRSSTPRSSTSRPFSFNVGKENTPCDSPTFETDQWNEFSAANSHISPVPMSPPRSSSASPFKKIGHRSRTPSVDNLIDTDNVLVNTNILPSKSVKNDVWETMNELNSTLSPQNISTMNDILLPKEISVQTLPEPIMTEFLDWSNEEMPVDLKPPVVFPSYHFEQRAPGTITERELQHIKEAEAGDQLVSFDDSPIVSTNNYLLHTETELLDLVDQEEEIKEEHHHLEPEPEPEPVQTNGGSSRHTEDVLGSSSPQQVSEEGEEKNTFSVTLRVATEAEGFVYLVVKKDEDIAEVVEEFCKKYDMMPSFDQLYKNVKEKYTKRQTKYVLKKTKPKKKRS